jgi:hypothetical protein
MKETVGSLQAYLVLSGAVATWFNLSDLNDVGIPWPFKVLGVVSIALSVMIIAAGVTLPRLLATRSTLVLRLIGVAFGYSLLTNVGLIGFVVSLIGFSAVPVSEYIKAAIGPAVLAYVYANAKRLAGEARAASAASEQTAT